MMVLSSSQFPAIRPIMILMIIALAQVIQAAAQSPSQDTIKTASEAAVQLLNTITITATRTERSTLETDRSVSVVTRKDLNVQTPRSVPEALFQQTGIWVQKTNHGGGSPVIRGMMGNQVLLLVDGIRMNNATYRFGPNQYLNTLDPYLLDRLEMVRGGGSVLYGSDAMGGVVQLFTHEPAFGKNSAFTINNGLISGGWMSAGMEASGSLRLDAGNDRLAVSAAGSMFSFGDLRAGGSLGTLAPTGYRQHSGSLRARVMLTPKTILTMAHQALIQREVPRYDQVVQGGYKQYDFDPQSRRLDYLRLEHHGNIALARKVIFTILNGATTEGLTTQKNGAATFKQQRDQVATSGFTAELESQPSAHWTIRSGAEFYHDFVRSTAHVTDLNTGTLTPVRGAYADGSVSSSAALYTSHQIDLNRFNFSGGLRYTRVALRIRDQRFGDQHITPDALVGSWSAGWKVSEPVRLYGSMHAGFRAPNVDDLSKFGTVESGIFEVPAIGLKSEHSLSREIGMKARTQKLAMSFAWYNTTVSDLVDRVPALFEGASMVEGRSVYRKANTGKARYTGLEAEVEFTVAPSFTLAGNLTRTFGENITKNEPARRIPPVFGRLSLQFHKGNIHLLLVANAAGKQDRLAAGDRSDARIAIRLVDGVMPGWTTIDASAGWTKGPWAININLRNLGNTAYRIYGSGVDGYGRHAALRLSRRFGGH